MSREASSKRRREEHDEDDDGLDARRYSVKRSSKGDDYESEFKQSRRSRRDEGNDVDLKHPIRSNGRDKEDGGRRRPDYEEDDGYDAKENGDRGSSKRDGTSRPKDRREEEYKRPQRSARDELEYSGDRSSKSFRKTGHGDAADGGRLERRDPVDEDVGRHKDERRKREDDRRETRDRRDGKEDPYDRRRDRDDRLHHDDDYDDLRAQSRGGEKKQPTSSAREKEKGTAETGSLGKQADEEKSRKVDVKSNAAPVELKRVEEKAGKIGAVEPPLDPQEAEQQRLADEMEKRRKRVQEWQEMRRKKEADEEAKSKGKAKMDDGDDGLTAGGSKAWTLDGDSDEEEEGGGGAGRKRLKKGKLSTVEDVRKVLSEPETKGESSSTAAAAAASAATSGSSEAGPSEAGPSGGEPSPSPMEADGAAASGSAAAAAPGAAAAAVADVDADVDPLDAFMNQFVLPEVAKQQEKEAEEKRKKREEAAVAKFSAAAAAGAGGKKAAAAVFGDEEGGLVKKKQPEPSGKKKGVASKAGGLFGGVKLELGKKKKDVVIQEPEIMGEDFDDEIDVGDEDDDEDGEGEKGVEDEDDQQFLKRVTAVAASKADKLPAVDHSKMDYAPFRKCFYKEVKEVARVSAEEVAAYRRANEFKLRGKDVPKPVQSWNHTGLTNRILEVIKKCGFEHPMPIQAQALPIIMSGRDCIGIAKTGSGKTLAFVLPMMRHIMDQVGGFVGVYREQTMEKKGRF